MLTFSKRDRRNISLFGEAAGRRNTAEETRDVRVIGRDPCRRARILDLNIKKKKKNKRKVYKANYNFIRKSGCINLLGTRERNAYHLDLTQIVV